MQPRPELYDVAKVRSGRVSNSEEDIPNKRAPDKGNQLENQQKTKKEQQIKKRDHKTIQQPPLTTYEKTSKGSQYQTRTRVVCG